MYLRDPKKITVNIYGEANPYHFSLDETGEIKVIKLKQDKTKIRVGVEHRGPTKVCCMFTPVESFSIMRCLNVIMSCSIRENNF